MVCVRGVNKIRSREHLGILYSADPVGITFVVGAYCPGRVPRKIRPHIEIEK
jgi:hypothetical protein